MSGDFDENNAGWRSRLPIDEWIFQMFKTARSKAKKAAKEDKQTRKTLYRLLWNDIPRRSVRAMPHVTREWGHFVCGGSCVVSVGLGSLGVDACSAVGSSWAVLRQLEQSERWEWREFLTTEPLTDLQMFSIS